MRVIPYYCATCGVRISPEDARFGRSAADDRTFHCPSCVVEHAIAVADSGQVDKDESSRQRPVRRGADAVGRAVDLPRDKRLSSRRRAGGGPAMPGASAGGASGASQRAGLVGGRAASVAAVGGSSAAGARNPLVLLGVGLLCGSLAWGAAAFFFGRTGATEPEAGAAVGGEQPGAAQAAAGGGDVTAGVGDAEASATAAEAAGPAKDAGDETDTGDADEAKAEAARAAAAAVAAAEAAAAEARAAQDPEGPYVLNTRTGKLHRKSCRWAQRMSDDNRSEFPSLAELRAFGMTWERCGTCLDE